MQAGVQIQGGPFLPAAFDVRTFETRDEWLVGRTGLGASEVAAALGLDPDKSEWMPYARHSPREIAKREERGAQRRLYERGHREEPLLFRDYANLSGVRVMHLSTAFVIVDGPAPLSVSPDAFLYDELFYRSWGTGEGKTDVSPFRYGRNGTVIESWDDPRAAVHAREVVREDYAAQCYSQLIATGLPWSRLVVRRSLDDVRSFTLMADPKIQAYMLEKLEEWWDLRVVRDIPPPPDASDACRRAQARLYGAGNLRSKEKRQATDEEKALALDAARAARNVAAWEEIKDTRRAQLAEKIGEGYGIEWTDDNGRKSSVIYIDKDDHLDLDHDLVRERYPDVYRECLVRRPANREIRLYVKDE